MKKVMISGGVFAAGSALQLICSIIFLFSPIVPVSEAAIQTVLLLASALGLIVMDIFLWQLNQEGSLDDRFKGLVFQAGRIAGMLLAAEALNLGVMTAAVVFSVPLWLQAVPTLMLVAACAAAVLTALRALRSEEAENGEEPDDMSQQTGKTENTPEQ